MGRRVAGVGSGVVLARELREPGAHVPGPGDL